MVLYGVSSCSGLDGQLIAPDPPGHSQDTGEVTRRKRLGGLRHQQIKQLLHEGRHREWIEQLLRDYYDPMYDYQLQNKSGNLAFTGNEAEVLAYLEALA